MASMQDGGRGAGPTLEALLGMAREMLAGGGQSDQLALLATLLQSRATSAPHPASQPDWKAAEFVGQAWLIAMISGFRYWRRLAALCDEHLSPMTSMAFNSGAHGLSEQERLALIEELRRLARELGDTAFQEARRFQTDLDRLALGLATPRETPPAAEPRRHAHAKP